MNKENFKIFYKLFSDHYQKLFTGNDPVASIRKWQDDLSSTNLSDQVIIDVARNTIKSGSYSKFPPSTSQFIHLCERVGKGWINSEINSVFAIVRSSYHRSSFTEDDDVIDLWVEEFGKLKISEGLIKKAAMNLIKEPFYGSNPPSFGDIFNETLRISVNEKLPMFHECLQTSLSVDNKDQIISNALSKHTTLGYSGRIDRESINSFLGCYQKSLIEGYTVTINELIEEIEVVNKLSKSDLDNIFK